MYAVRYHAFGGREVLQLDTVPEPQPHDGDVLIRISRAGVAPLDDKVRAGVLPATMHKPLPLVPGASAVGRVEEPGTSGFRPGTRVLPAGWGYGTSRDGTWRELAAVAAAHLVPIPDSVTDDRATALAAGAGYLTAWLALTKVHGLQPGQVVLAPGIYGAVASAAAQVAPLLGATQVISTVRGSARANAVPSDAGVSIIDLSTEDLGAGVRRLTAGAGVDVVLDSLGGALTGQALRTLRPGGTHVAIGYTAGTAATIDVTDVIWKTLQLKGFCSQHSPRRRSPTPTAPCSTDSTTGHSTPSSTGCTRSRKPPKHNGVWSRTGRSDECSSTPESTPPGEHHRTSTTHHEKEDNHDSRQRPRHDHHGT